MKKKKKKITIKKVLKNKLKLKKVKKKKIKRVKKSKLQKYNFFQKLYILAVLVVIVAFMTFKPNTSPQKTFAKVLENIPLSPVATQTASLILSPTESVSPTPQPHMDQQIEGNTTPPQTLPTNINDFCVHVPVLMYHHIQPQTDAVRLGQTALSVDNGIFDQQMQYLASSGYTPIWANDLIEALISKSGLPGKPVVITMDDGYADNYLYALPVLQKYSLKANLMLASGLVGNDDMLSWDQVNGLKSSGLIYFTNHTWSHYAISEGPQEKIESEIDIAQSEIQNSTGQTVNVFTYPYGSFNDNAIATLQRKNYIGAFSTNPGQDQCDSFIMSLHRTRIGNSPLSSYGL